MTSFNTFFADTLKQSLRTFTIERPEPIFDLAESDSSVTTAIERKNLRSALSAILKRDESICFTEDNPFTDPAEDRYAGYFDLLKKRGVINIIATEDMLNILVTDTCALAGLTDDAVYRALAFFIARGETIDLIEDEQDGFADLARYAAIEVLRAAGVEVLQFNEDGTVTVLIRMLNKVIVCDDGVLAVLKLDGIQPAIRSFMAYGESVDFTTENTYTDNKILGPAFNLLKDHGIERILYNVAAVFSQPTLDVDEDDDLIGDIADAEHHS